jgi:hypothetical protein
MIKDENEEKTEKNEVTREKREIISKRNRRLIPHISL